jgi:glycine oxidase
VPYRIAVVGGGVIGSAVAFTAARRGDAVTLIEPDFAASASWLAGGMLAPITEAWPGEEGVTELGVASLACWPAFAETLAACGHEPGLRSDGTVVAAVDSADKEVLTSLAEHLDRRGRTIETLTGRALRAREPAIGPGVRGGLSVPEDLSVDNRKLLSAMRAAAEEQGARLIESTVARVEPGLAVLDDGREVGAEHVVLAAGAWSGRLHPALAHAVRPVKGEILRLRPRRGSLPPPRRTVRAHVRGRPIYLVPRADGEVVLGATQYEAGFDTEPAVAGVRDLISDAEQVMPAIADYALAEARAGLRAGSPDNLPLLGELEPGLLVATGHHRNGLLLAPLTAEAVLRLTDGATLPEVLSPAGLHRLEDAREATGV